MRMNNRWNQLIYRIWSPFYDALLEGFFHPGRKKALSTINLRAGERVCFVGVGTGSDLLFLPPDVSAVGIDLSESMLERARRKMLTSGSDVTLQVGDAQALSLEARVFDAVVLNLILSVVPDPSRCLSEALRVLRPEGRIVIFDKFLPDSATPSFGRKLANSLATLFGTDINRRLGDILEGMPCRVESDEPSLLGGMYRVVLLRKTQTI